MTPSWPAFQGSDCAQVSLTMYAAVFVVLLGHDAIPASCSFWPQMLSHVTANFALQCSTCPCDHVIQRFSIAFAYITCVLTAVLLQHWADSPQKSWLRPAPSATVVLMQDSNLELLQELSQGCQLHSVNSLVQHLGRRHHCRCAVLHSSDWHRHLQMLMMADFMLTMVGWHAGSSGRRTG